jgi:tRNA A-37 threonylcarbamoyl transferase component Bud32
MLENNFDIEKLRNVDINVDIIITFDDDYILLYNKIIYDTNLKDELQQISFLIKDYIETN